MLDSITILRRVIWLIGFLIVSGILLTLLVVILIIVSFGLFRFVPPPDPQTKPITSNLHQIFQKYPDESTAELMGEKYLESVFPKGMPLREIIKKLELESWECAGVAEVHVSCDINNIRSRFKMTSDSTGISIDNQDGSSIRKESIDLDTDIIVFPPLLLP
jgi:hypothetical protein